MDRPHHPNVVRTWVVERTRHPVHAALPIKREDPRHGAPRIPAPTHGKSGPGRKNPDRA